MLQPLLALSATLLLIASAMAQSQHLEQILARRTMQICIWPDYYGITFRSPTTQQLSGIDIDLAHELASELGVVPVFIDSSFSRLIDDISQDRCDIAMFAVGILPARAEKLAFSPPYLQSDIYAITTRSNRRIKNWNDIDRPGRVVAVAKGTLQEVVMKEKLRHASLKVLDSPHAREQEVESGRADAFMTDYPYSRRMLETTDWARLISPTGSFHQTPYAYAIRKGDEAWQRRITQFVRDIQHDGRLREAAKRHNLESIIVEN